MNNQLFLLILLALFWGCSAEEAANSDPDKQKKFTSFKTDVDFLKKHTDILVLEEPGGSGKVAVSAALQARVMTSTSLGAEGRSYGWINSSHFESGDTLDHMNPFGGEERFWLGPEGGQYSIFFEAGTSFDFDNWQTPYLIDLAHFELVETTGQKAVFRKSASLTNYAGFTFQFEIDRMVEVLSKAAVFQGLDLREIPDIKVVGYQTTNIVTNTGAADWGKENGLLSIWLLGMFNPSDSTTVVIPFVTGEEEVLGPVVNDTYFGKVPAERLIRKENVLFFKGDGKYRSKIGLVPGRARNILGSYDAEGRILTIVRYNKPAGVTDYVNSLWEMQEEPYGGDVINSYNDGPVSPGGESLGGFYELETSSPALALPAGESGTHIQETYHFEGEEPDLDEIVRKLLGVSLAEIKTAF